MPGAGYRPPVTMFSDLLRRAPLGPSSLSAGTTPAVDGGDPIAPCIWNCGRPADSDEDVLAEWIRDYLGAKTGRKRWMLRDLTPIDSPIRTTDNPRPGPRRGHRVKADKIVCQRCNNGWMSELQNMAKLTLLAMFEGRSVTLGPSVQSTLLSWCTMTAICNHYASRQEIDESRRDYFYKQHSPPPYTEVFLAYIPRPELDTMHAAGGWRDRLTQRPHAYVDVLGIKQLGLLILQGWLPPPARSVLDGAASMGPILKPPVDLSSSQTWPPPTQTTTEDFGRLFDSFLLALRPEES
jgi:hypothetical protein